MNGKGDGRKGEGKKEESWRRARGRKLGEREPKQGKIERKTIRQLKNTIKTIVRKKILKNSLSISTSHQLVSAS